MTLKQMTISENITNNHLDLTDSAIGHFSSLLKNKDNQNIRIGIRDGKTHIENIEVDKKILEAGHHHGSTYYEHLAFLKAIENNSDPEVSLEDGLIAVAVGEAAEQSIKQGRLIKLEEIIN